MNGLKELLKKWKVEVYLVGGALVVATTYGKCVYEPSAVESDDVETVEVATETTETTTQAAEAAETAEANTETTENEN